MKPPIEIIPIGGYSDFGRNMTAVRVGREIVLFDMGIKLDPLQDLPEGEGVDTLDVATLRNMEAIPDDRLVQKLDGKVVAIVISHAHTDHASAVPKLAARYKDAPIIASPYTIRFIEDLCEDRRSRDRKNPRLTIPNRLISVKGRNQIPVGNHGLNVELVHTTHSIPGATIPVLHTPRGAIVYALDFKFDDTPVVGKKPDYQRLDQIGRDGVYALITESTNAEKNVKTDSEAVARLRLQGLMQGVDHSEESLFVTTFASNTARVASAIEFAKDMDREVLVLGRSMDKYQRIAADLGFLDLTDDVRIFRSRNLALDALRMVEKDRSRYMVLLTGHQGEPGAMLTRIAADETPYRLDDRDDVVFASHTIPNPQCIERRGALESRLDDIGCRVYHGAHASGHASGVDHREMLMMLDPEHIIPAHGGPVMQEAYARLAGEEGWRPRKEIHVLRNGQRFEIGKHPSPQLRKRKVDAKALESPA